MTPGKTNTIVATNSDVGETSQTLNDAPKIITVIIDGGGAHANALDGTTNNKSMGSDENVSDDGDEEATNGDMNGVLKSQRSVDEKAKTEVCCNFMRGFEFG